MKIETRYDCGNVVWFMEDNKPHFGTIIVVKPPTFFLNIFNVAMMSGETTYTVEKEGVLINMRQDFSEKRLFPTKESLVESLLK